MVHHANHSTDGNLMAGQKKERLKALVLKDKDIGTMLDDNKGQEWGHVRWARQVQRLAQSFGDSNCQYLDVVLNGVPDLLRDQLADTYANWAAFLAGVNGVSINLLNRARARAVEEWTMREDITQLKARPYNHPTSNTPTAPAAPIPITALQQPAVQAPMNLVPPQYQAPTYQTKTVIPTYQPQPTMPGQNLFAAPGVVPSINLFYCYQQAPQTPSCPGATEHVRIAAQYSTLPHHTDSEAGQAAYTQQVKDWHNKHGTDAMPHMGEYFACGLVTVPFHKSTGCPHTPLAPQEMKWQEIVSSTVGCTVRAQNPPMTPSTVVQYVAPAQMGYYDPAGAYNQYQVAYVEQSYEYPGNGMGLLQ
ncbi:hypothetical protein F4604DRAFT_1686237 [Suillus subluteus]|nr:hypothetical protein F4604DRAFT_1686237 [Suillus subluteus]